MSSTFHYQTNELVLEAPDPRRVKNAVTKLTRLPASFPVLQEALRMTEDPLCSFQELERVLQVDQSLTAQLLRLANSAFYAMQSPIASISRAITVIGQIKLRMLLMQMFVAGLFHRMVGQEPLADEIWDDSVAAAAGCKAVGEFFSDLDADELLVAGLLHNVGEFALLSQFSQEYQAAISLQDEMTHYAAQHTIFGTDSRKVGRWLLEAWRLPRILADAVEYWETPWEPTLDSDGKTFMNLIHVGVQLGRSWNRGRNVEELMAWLDKDTLGHTGLTVDSLSRIYGNLSETVARVQGLRDVVRCAA